MKSDFWPPPVTAAATSLGITGFLENTHPFPVGTRP